VNAVLFSLGGLKSLQDSWNPEWNESGVWPLISPFLTHVNNGKHWDIAFLVLMLNYTHRN